MNSKIIDNSYTVDPEAIETYARDGVVKIENPFDPYWIDGLVEVYERIMRDAERGETNHKIHRTPTGMTGLQNVILREPFYKKWAMESPVSQIVGEVLQSSTARFYFDNFFIKEGNDPGAATMLHHDVAAFGFKGTQLPSFWVALGDVEEDNAPLICALGSHKDTSFMWRSPIQKPGLPLLDGYREPSGIPAYIEENGFEIKSFPAKKGDVVIFSPYVIHGSKPRVHGAGKRTGFSSRWFGDDVRWEPTIYNEMEASMHSHPIPYGARPSDDMFPIIWSKDEGRVAAKTGKFTTLITLEPKDRPIEGVAQSMGRRS